MLPARSTLAWHTRHAGWKHHATIRELEVSRYINIIMKYIVLLRGINVSGKNKLKMADLRAMLEAMNFANVQTYIQSGNIILETEEMPNTELAERIKAQIKTTFDYDVPTLALRVGEWREIFQNNPFLQKRNEDIKALYVTILAELPNNELVNTVKDFQHKADEFQIIGKNIYIFCPDGYGRTKLTNNFFERKLKVAATTRNWKTMTKLMELSE